MNKDNPFELTEGESTTRRHSITIDAVSLLEGDAVVNDVESHAVANFEFQHMIRNLESIFEKFVAISLEFGFQENEVAFMMSKHPSTITRIKQRMISSLKEKRKKELCNK